MHAGRCGDDGREGDEAGGAGGVFVYAQEREGGALYSIRRGGAGLGDGSEDVIVSGNTLLQANALRIPLADESVHMVCTSPPYWGLRSYGIGTDNGELGLEATIDEYVANMVAVFREVKRVLHPSGTCWINLGDSYAANRSYQVPDTK